MKKVVFAFLFTLFFASPAFAQWAGLAGAIQRWVDYVENECHGTVIWTEDGPLIVGGPIVLDDLNDDPSDLDYLDDLIGGEDCKPDKPRVDDLVGGEGEGG